MRVFHLTQGYQILISNEQSELLDKFETHEPVLKRSLDERERVVANELVNKGVLTRCMVKDRLAYCKPDPEQVWRI